MIDIKKLFLPTCLMLLLPACWPFTSSEKQEQFQKKQAPTSHVQAITTQEEYEKCIKSGLVIAQFHATWCPPCKRMKPIVSAAAEKYDSQVKFITIDIDTQDTNLKKTVNNLVKKGVPTFVYFKNGKIIENHPGSYSAAKFNSAVDDFITKEK